MGEDEAHTVGHQSPPARETQTAISDIRKAKSTDISSSQNDGNQEAEGHALDDSGAEGGRAESGEELTDGEDPARRLNKSASRSKAPHLKVHLLMP